jgi:hypothetical protein
MTTSATVAALVPIARCPCHYHWLASILHHRLSYELAYGACCFQMTFSSLPQLELRLLLQIY